VAGSFPGRVLVLGGTGFIGAAVAAEFQHMGAKVIVLARNRPVGSSAVEGCEIVEGDANVAGTIDALLDGVDLVVHAVGQPLPAESNIDPVADASTSLTSVLRVLESLARMPHARLIFISSGGTIYGNVADLPISEVAECWPISSYGVMKLAAEKYLAMYHSLHGVASVSLRVANAYGPGQPVRPSQGFIAACLDAARRGTRIQLYGSGRNVRDYIYIDDVARAVVGLAGCDSLPPVVNVGSGVGWSLIDILGLVEKVTGRVVEVEHLPRRAVDVEAIVLSTRRLGSLLNWHPIDLEEGLGRSWEHLHGARPLDSGTR
jgi:UDP-glucose 4-epimerase